jgi:benzodiazapine receptor
MTEVNTRPIDASNSRNLAAYVLNVAVTFAIGAGGFLDRPTNGELSLKYQTLMTPVGWAFSIWGIIFTLQAIWVLVPLFASQQRNTAWVTAVGYNYVFVCLAQSAWTLCFSYELMGLSVICMYAILFFLGRAVRELLPLAVSENYSISQYTLRVAPFTMHMAWIIAASFVNLSVLLVKLNVSAAMLFYVSVTSLLILFGTALFFLRIDTIVPAVLAWPLLGIYAELGSPADAIVAAFTTNQINFIRYAAISGAIIVVVGVLVRLVLMIFRGNGGGGASRQDTGDTEAS